MKVSLDKEISKKQMKKIMGREGERERVRASWCAKMEESKIFNWLRIEVQFITR
jgi:flagellar biosynthesis chaperone FliJ